MGGNNMKPVGGTLGLKPGYHVNLLVNGTNVIRLDFNCPGALVAVRRNLIQSERKHSSRATGAEIMRGVSANGKTELKAHRARQAQEKLFLGQAYEDNDLVFCQPNGKPLDPRGFTKKYARLLEAAGVPKVGFHALRHTFGTLLLEAGEDMRTIQEVLRHTRISTTADIYVEVTDKLKKRAADRIDAVLNNAVQNASRRIKAN